MGGTLLEHPEVPPFSFVPLATSLLVSVGGIYIGWLVYRNVTLGAEDPLKKPLGTVYSWLQNKYYFDELYDRIFVQPAYWLSATFTSAWMDRKVIDGVLHFFGEYSSKVGRFLRNVIDLPIVNGFGDKVGEYTNKLGHFFRPFNPFGCR